MSDNSPIYTGWLQMQLSGDIDAAKMMVREGRKVLGNMLNDKGINSLADAGEPTGFHKTYRKYPDGTRITAWHNNGHNVVRIDTPPKVVKLEPPQHETPKGHDWQGDYRPKGHSEGHEPQVVDPPVLKTARPEEEEEEEKNPHGYYMWCGIRAASQNVPYYAVSGCMIEPKVEGAPGRGILDANEYWGSSTLVFNSDFTFGDAYNNNRSFADCIAEDYDVWLEYSRNTMQYGDHCTTVFLDTDIKFLSARVFASVNGLLCMANDLVDDSYASDFMQYDPLTKKQDGSDRPDPGNRDPHNSGRYLPPLRNWDVVWELDPDPFEFPSDQRPWRTKMVEKLEKDCGMATGDEKVLPGLYMLTVNIQDSPPRYRSRRGGETIPTSEVSAPFNKRSNTSDYDDYLYLTDATVNTGVQIEVRLGKGKEMTIFKFETVIVGCDDRFNVTAPFGDRFPYNDCLKEGGANPMGANFMQTPIAIDVMGGVADWADKFENATVMPMFGGGTYGIPGDDRKELLLCVHGNYGVSQPNAETFPEYAAYAAWRVLEEATAGIFGQMKFKEMSEGTLRNIFAGGNRKMVNVLNCWTGELALYPIVSDRDSYPFITPEGQIDFDSPYSEWAYWYYPYKVFFKSQCFNTMGIVIVGFPTGYGTEFGQTRIGEYKGFPAEPAPPDCCSKGES